MVFGSFPKIGTKLFILTLKKKYGYILFLLSFGLRVHFQGKKLIFWQKKNPPKIRRPLLLKSKKNYHPFY
jgi:hypothetical protein